MKQARTLVVVGISAALIAACSSSKAKPGSSTPAAARTSAGQPTTSAPASVASTTTTAPSSSAPRTVAGLSGTWQGKYGGSYSGTFVLHWKQSTSSKLTGTINLSTGPGPLTINGMVSGGRIQFGTVGSQAITYTGSVSGNSMHGDYKIAGGAGGSGTWSAARA